jgi:hypothetical protein
MSVVLRPVGSAREYRAAGDQPFLRQRWIARRRAAASASSAWARAQSMEASRSLIASSALTNRLFRLCFVDVCCTHDGVGQHRNQMRLDL